MGPGTRPFYGSPYCFTYSVYVGNILFDDCIGWQGLDSITFDPVSRAAAAQFQQLDCCGADIQADQRWFGPFEELRYWHNISF
jgi:hypothetical protein